MGHTRRNTLGILAVLAAGAVSATAFAMQPGWAGEPGARGGCLAQPGRTGMMQVDPAARAEGRLAMLRAELEITPDQEQAWEAFAQTLRAQAGTARPGARRFAATGTTAPERFNQRIEFMQRRLEHLQTVSQAMQEFYSHLTPEQKTTADRLFARRPF